MFHGSILSCFPALHRYRSLQNLRWRHGPYLGSWRGFKEQSLCAVRIPEGTTSDGHELCPFKTPLFEAARFAVVASDHDHALIQPVALDYSHLHGLPIARQWRQHIAWPGDVGLAESLLPLIRKGALDVTIHCGEPIIFTADSKRKIVAQQSRQSIRALLGKASLDSPL